MAKITGIKVGSSNITATYGSLTSNSVTLNVTALNLATVGSIGALSNQVYTGSAIKLEPTVTVTATGVGTNVTLTKGTHYTVAWTSSDSNACTAVGTVTVTVTGKGNYTGSISTTYQITGATITVKTSGQSSVINQVYTYNTTAQGVGLTATTVNSQTATIKYGTTSGTYNLTSAPQATAVADSKTVYYQVTAPNHVTKTGSYTLTINAATISIPSPTGNTKTYNGTAYSATFPAATGASITKYRYDTNGGSTWTETTTAPSRTVVGTTTVQAYYTAGTNYTGSGWSSTASIKINAADFTVSAGNQSYPWTGNAQGSAITVSNLKGSQTATIRYRTASSGDYNLTSAPQITNVSQSPLTVYWQVTAPNHNTQTGSYTITITAPAISIPSPTSTTHVYTGSAYTATFPTASYASITNYRYSTDNSTWTTSSTNPSQTTVNKIYVQAYYTADGNHTGSGWSSSATVEVTNATITVSAPAQSYTYDGSAHGAAITATTVNSQTATIKYGTTSGTYNLTSAPQITNVSESKTIYYQVTAPNHTTKTGSYSLAITKATPTFALNGQTVEYHNTAYIKARASVVGTIHWGTSTSSMSSTTSVTTPSTSSFNTTVTSRGDAAGVGTTTIYAWFEPTDTGNYNSVGSSSSYAESAAAKTEQSGDNDISVTLSSNLYYNGSNQVIATKTSDEGCAHFTLGYSTTSNGTVTWGTEDATTLSVAGPGTYYVHYKVTPDSNHKTTITDKQLDGTVVIGSGTLTITITGYSGTYNGSAHSVVASGPTAKNQASATVTGVTYTYSTSESGTYSSSVPTRTDACPDGLTYYCKAEKAGYTTKIQPFTVTIQKANNPISITPTTATIYNTTGYNTVQINVSGAQGTVSYSSNATGKATVSNSGLVTYVAAGEATITVNAAGNSNYKSGSKTCVVTTVVDTVRTYGDITGTITITQKTQFPAGGIGSLSTSNINTYFKYTSTAAQTITWVSGNTTNGTISYAWSGTTTTIPSLGTSETTAVTPRTISFTVTATGEGSKTKSASVSSGNQEANPVTAITLTLVTAGDSGYTPKTQVAFGSSLNTRLIGTFKSGSSGEVTPSSVTSSDTTVAEVS